jgi:hypothetical protein
MWYVVTGLVPARIEVRPSNGLGGSRHPDLACGVSARCSDWYATCIQDGSLYDTHAFVDRVAGAQLPRPQPCRERKRRYVRVKGKAVALGFARALDTDVAASKGGITGLDDEELKQRGGLTNEPS